MNGSTLRQRLNGVSTIGLVVLSLTTLLPLVLIAVPAMLAGNVTPEPDEGAGAHIFQLSVAALLPVGFLFLVTAEWTRPTEIARRLALPAGAVLLAFAILYYFEHLYRSGR